MYAVVLITLRSIHAAAINSVTKNLVLALFPFSVFKFTTPAMPGCMNAGGARPGPGEPSRFWKCYIMIPLLLPFFYPGRRKIYSGA